MTPERYTRILQIIATRQPDLTLCLEQVHKPHNLSAIIRTADAVGIHQLHAIWPGEKMRTLVSTAAGSNSWVKVITHQTIKAAVTALKKQNMQIIATHLDETAIDFREIDYTQPTCILMGQEKYGISANALAMADQHIVIPMVGMVQSLNVSVASALVLYEAQRQRQLAGLYQRKQSNLDQIEQNRLIFEGGYPVLAAVAKRKKLPQPDFDQQGNIIASPEWWATIQSIGS